MEKITDIPNHQWIIKYNSLERVVDFTKESEIESKLNEMKQEIRDNKIQKIIDKDDSK